MKPELSLVTKFYVEGHTAEGAPYGPVHILSTPLEEMWEAFEPLSKQAQAWKDGGATAGEWLESLSAQRG